MRRLVSVEEMREMDRQTIEERGIPGFTLMQTAGQGVAEIVLDIFTDLEDARIIVLAGRGNNGGDGFIAARQLLKFDTRPVVVLVGGGVGDLSGDAAQAHAEWAAAAGKTVEVPDGASVAAAWADLDEPDLVIDALLGTGTQGEPRGAILAAVELLESSLAPVVAIDSPTGLDADTGRVPGACVHADITVTLALPKRGQFLYPGRAFVGELHWVDIGIPPDIMDSGDGPRAYVIEPEDVAEMLPDREPEMHKGDRGRLLVVGGSAGMTGAVALATRAAVRAGAGLVTAGVPLSLSDILETKVTEAMTLPLSELDARALSRDAFGSIALFHPGRLTAMAVGPGMGRHSSTRDLVRQIVSEIDIPMVLDADGLLAYAGEADLLRMSAPGKQLVLTPHPGEFMALTGESPRTLAEDRLGVVARWARRLETVIVLKGAPTVIAEPDGETVHVNPTGSEALATGGTGDVLTGLIAGFLAQGVEPVDAAVLGAYLHGWTADCLVEEWGSRYGLEAGDLVDYFPFALGFLLSPEAD